MSVPSKESDGSAQGSAQEFFVKIAASYEKNTGGATRVIAKHLAELCQPVNADVSILDNACGTGIVIEELLAGIDSNKVRESLNIRAVDGAQAMIELFKQKAENVWKLPKNHVQADALPAEELDSLPSDTFDYSFTNFGFQFFKDPDKAARDICRTLKPGGKAFITNWQDLGYTKAITAAAQKVRPEKPTPTLPFNPDLFKESYVRESLKRAGFSDVKTHIQESFYSASSVPDLAETLTGLVSPMLKIQGWSDEETANFPEALRMAFEKQTEGIEVGDNIARVRMEAIIAICSK